MKLKITTPDVKKWTKRRELEGSEVPMYLLLPTRDPVTEKRVVERRNLPSLNISRQLLWPRRLVSPRTNPTTSGRRWTKSSTKTKSPLNNQVPYLPIQQKPTTNFKADSHNVSIVYRLASRNQQSSITGNIPSSSQWTLHIICIPLSVLHPIPIHKKKTKTTQYLDTKFWGRTFHP